MAAPNSWSFTTNWTIAGGDSPDTIVKVSSSDSEESPNATFRRNTLILEAPSSDDHNSGPCEIKISFKHSHEIKKIYVRSTVRTYEVHYTPALQSNDVYHCTVGCNMASKEEDVLHAIDNEEDREAISKNLKVSNEEIAYESDIDLTKDEWVVVGIPAPPLVQDFYEAATETNDADPCISVTLRLFSPHSKVLIHIDEIRVFADALESSDSGSTTSQGENSAGSTLMATLAPTLSQSTLSCFQDEHARRVDEQGTRSGTPDLTEATSGAQAIGNCNTPDQPTQSQSQAKASDREEKHDLPCGQVGKVLERLLLRVCKIEDLFSRFGKITLKSINNMEERLKKVEQYMELQAKNSKCPACLMTESNSNAFFYGDRVHPSCSTSEVQNGNPASSHKPVDDTSKSVGGPQFVPRLVVTAPAFSCDEGEEENISLEPPKVFPQGQAKETLSVVDIQDRLSAFNIQSPQIFSRPSSLQRDPIPLTNRISKEEFGLPAETRQDVLESFLGGFGQVRQIGTDLPDIAATPTNASGCGFVGYTSNGFSKTAAQGGCFTSRASAGEDDLGAASSAGEVSTSPTAGGGLQAAVTNHSGPTATSGNGFTTAATSGGAPSAASRGVCAPAAPSSDDPVFGCGCLVCQLPVERSIAPTSVPTTASGGGFTAPAINSGVFVSAAMSSDVPVAGFGSGSIAPATSFGFGPAIAYGGGFIAPPIYGAAPAAGSRGLFASAATGFDVPVAGFGRGSIAPPTSFGFRPPIAYGGGFLAPVTTFDFGPAIAYGGGFLAPATYGPPPAAGSRGLFSSAATGSDVPVAGFGSGSIAPTTSSGAPTTASGGEFTAPATNSGAPAAAFGGGYNLSGGFGALSGEQGSDAFSMLNNYGQTGPP